MPRLICPLNPMLSVVNPCREFIALQLSLERERSKRKMVSNPCREFIALQPSRQSESCQDTVSFKPLSGIHRVATRWARPSTTSVVSFQTPVGNSSRCNLCVVLVVLLLGLVSNPCREFIALQRNIRSDRPNAGPSFQTPVGNSSRCNLTVDWNWKHPQIVSNPCREFIALQLGQIRLTAG